MNFLLDTNAISDLMREDVRVASRLDSLAEADRVVICAIVRGEIRYGLARMPDGKRRQALESKAAILFSATVCEPMLETVGGHYGRIKSESQTRGLSVDENDLWIAATSIALGATLVSRDAVFLRISGLDVEDWSSA